MQVAIMCSWSQTGSLPKLAVPYSLAFSSSLLELLYHGGAVHLFETDASFSTLPLLTL